MILCNSSEQKESSPVQNHKIVNNPLGAVNDILKVIPKKCTCPRPEPRLPEELLNNCCGRCGGVL